MKFFTSVAVSLGCLGLVACAVQPHSESGAIADAFMAYKGPSTARNDFAVSQQPELAGKMLGNGYVESHYFVFYWPSPECVEGYTVFERCAGEPACVYRFEAVEGVCD